MAGGIITTIVRALFQSQGAGKVVQDIKGLGTAAEDGAKKQTRLANESTNTGRAFSSQASGLGGLVAAYAGAAATTFALQQGFATLKSVAEFEQVIGGTRSLAATLGQSGDVILKNIKDITKGQLALKEAATVANLALSSGFNTRQISELSKVATNASRVLGRDLSDSFNRIIRGAAKLEPELLDELGIFTRIDPAVQAYAARIGRAASSLTDAERRQAFLNAVIEEGTRKFGNINSTSETSAEIFNRLGATLLDLGNRLGSIIADVLAPIAKFFSEDLGNSLALFISILAITLSKAKSLLTDFLNTSAQQIATRGGQIARNIAGPVFAETLAGMGKTIAGVTLTGFNRAEQAVVKSIREGTLQPQQVPLAIETLGKFQERRQDTSNLSERGQAQAKTQLAAIEKILPTLTRSQETAGSAAVRTGRAFEFLSVALGRVANFAATAVSGLSIFTTALVALQLGAELIFGADLIGGIFKFFEKIREGGKQTTETINGIIASASKDIVVSLKVEYSEKDITEALKAVQDTIDRGIQGEPFKKAFTRPFQYLQDITRLTLANLGAITPQQDLRMVLQNQRKELAADLTLTPDQRAAALRIFDDFYNTAVKENLSASIVSGIMAGVKRAGGEAQDYFKTLKLAPQFAALPRLTTQGTAAIGGETIALTDEKLGNIAANAILATSTVVKFNEELDAGAITASQAGEKNVAITNRLLEIDKLIGIERNKAIKAEDINTILRINAIQLGLRDLRVQKDLVNATTERLVKQEALVKFLDKTFTTEREIGANLQFSGVLKDGKLVENVLEQYTNRLQLFNKVLSESRFDEFTKRATEAQERLAPLSQRLNTIENSLTTIAGERRDRLQLQNSEFAGIAPYSADSSADLIKERNTLLVEQAKLQSTIESAVSATTERYTELKKLSEDVTGAIVKQGLEVANVLKTEERRRIDLESQLGILERQNLAIAQQNKISLMQAQEETRQRAGRANLQVQEAELNLLKQRETYDRNRIDLLNKQNDRLKTSADLLLKERQIQSELRQENLQNVANLNIIGLELRKSIAEMLPGLGTEADRINLERDLAIRSAQLQRDLINERRGILEDEYTANKAELDRRENLAREEQLAFMIREDLFQNTEKQLQKERDLVTARRALEDSRLTNERNVLNQQTELARLQGVQAFIQARLEGDRRNYDLDIIDKQITLYEEQRTIFNDFLTGFTQKINDLGVVLGSLEPAVATTNMQQFVRDMSNANTEFANRVSSLREGLTASRTASMGITKAQQDAAGLTFRGQRNVNDERIKGIEAEIAALEKLRIVEDQIRELTEAAKRAERAEEAAAITSRLANLQTERRVLEAGILRDRVRLLNDENGITGRLNSALATTNVKADKFAQLINDISTGIQQNLNTAVSDFFKQLNRASQEGKTTAEIFKQSLKGLGVSVLETIQQSLAKKFITEPLQEFVGGLFGGLFPQTADSVLSNAYDPVARAIRVTASPIGQAQQSVMGEIGSALGSGIREFGSSVGRFLGLPAFSTAEKAAYTASQTSLANSISAEAAWTPSAIGGQVRQMASGGSAGLRDSVPALLEPGEFVIRRPAAMAIGGASLNQMNATGQVPSGNVMVNVVNQGTPQTVQGTPKVTRQGENLVVDIIVKDIQNNGPIRQTLKGMR